MPPRLRVMMRSPVGVRIDMRPSTWTDDGLRSAASPPAAAAAGAPAYTMTTSLQRLPRRRNPPRCPAMISLSPALTL